MPPWFRLMLIRTAPDHDGSFSCTPSGVSHLIAGDFAVLALVGGQEIVKGLQMPVAVGLEAQRVVDPGADTLGVPFGDGLLRHCHQLGIDRCGKAPFSAHTFILRLSHDRGIGGHERPPERSRPDPWRPGEEAAGAPNIVGVLGLWLLACSRWLGVLTVVAPVYMTNMLVRHTGKRLLEKHMARSKGAARPRPPPGSGC